MSDLFDALDELVSPGDSGSDVRAKSVPEKWRPQVDLGDDGGFVVATPTPLGNSKGAEDILKDFGLDPSEWRVTNVRQGKWQTHDGTWLETKRVNLVPIAQKNEATLVASPNAIDAEKLIDEVKKWRPTLGSRWTSGRGAFLVAPSDQQIGKRQGGGGTASTVKRILEATDASYQRLLRLRQAGLGLGTVVLALPGDHVEGNTSQGGRLQGLAASDLGLTEQVRVARRLLLAQIKAFAPNVERLIIPVVNGNHDEVTRQVSADPADGWNVEIAAAVQDACAENPDLGHVEFRYPASGHQTLTVDIHGTMLGLFHGHQAGRDVVKYLSGQAAGQTALGGADLWISGHFHNFRTMDIGERLWVQTPTLDPGSDWFRDASGMVSKPGILTMVIGDDYDPREWIGVIPST